MMIPTYSDELFYLIATKRATEAVRRLGVVNDTATHKDVMKLVWAALHSDLAQCASQSLRRADFDVTLRPGETRERRVRLHLHLSKHTAPDGVKRIAYLADVAAIT